jgi:hypothetical protein
LAGEFALSAWVSHTAAFQFSVTGYPRPKERLQLAARYLPHMAAVFGGYTLSANGLCARNVTTAVFTHPYKEIIEVQLSQ